MELISTTVARRTKRNGKPVWVARCIYLDDNGKRREKTKEAGTKNSARDEANIFRHEFERSEGREVLARAMTFNQLADHCEKHYLKPAEYKGDRKTSGLRSLNNVKNNTEVLRRFFGNLKIKKISYGDLQSFRQKQLSHVSTRTGKTLSFASVNRQLALLRRMLNIAVRENWIPKNPFNSGETLISQADETKRERILSKAEEKALLNACITPRELVYERKRKNGKVETVTWIDDGESRKHLKPIIICALDTGMRQGEIFSLTWRDVDFDDQTINIRAFNTKTAKARQVPITPRLLIELESLWNKANGNLDALCFGVTDTVKRSFGVVREIAGLDDFRFHDLRHTAATRLVRSNLPIAEVGRILGHTNPQTTYRYVNVNADTMHRAREAFANYEEFEPPISEAVN